MVKAKQFSAKAPELVGEPVVRTCKMSEDMRDAAIKVVDAAVKNKLNEKETAESLRSYFNEEYGTPWHCVVGSHFSTRVSYAPNHYLQLDVGDNSVLLFKTEE